MTVQPVPPVSSPFTAHHLDSGAGAGAAAGRDCVRYIEFNMFSSFVVIAL